MKENIIRGKVWKFGDNVSTDLMMPSMIPAEVMQSSPEEQASYCMRANRPEFAQEVQAGDIIVAGRNFGCGSSRPATGQLITLGIGCVAAESFSRIFFRNSVNLGMPLLDCKGISEAFSEGDILEADFETAEIRNLTTGKCLKANPLPQIVLRILAAGGILPLLKAEYSRQ